jgi:hypothetical protein
VCLLEVIGCNVGGRVHEECVVGTQIGKMSSGGDGASTGSQISKDMFNQSLFLYVRFCAYRNRNFSRKSSWTMRV